jgi:hypothetical protein
MGWCPPSLRVVSLGLSRRTVHPPTMTASLLARSAKTRWRLAALLTHALCPAAVAILPSAVIAYLSTPSGAARAARCRRASLADRVESRAEASDSAGAEQGSSPRTWGVCVEGVGGVGGGGWGGRDGAEFG